MKRRLSLIAICLAVVASASLSTAKESHPKPGRLTGTWECQAHGGSQGDMAFTLYLQQNKEIVDGSISSPIGGTQITSGTFRRDMLEIHLETPQGNYVIMGKIKKGQFSGTWTSETDKGTWEGKKQPEAPKP
jgi:hypothetical protein